jgi:hypothetical protein
MMACVSGALTFTPLGFQGSEIAEMIGKHRNTYESQLSQARTLLKKVAPDIEQELRNEMAKSQTKKR